MTVDRAERIGLSIGQSKEIADRMDTLVKDGIKSTPVEVKVGSTVRVTLQADPEDAEITPSDAVDASTGSDIAMLWTWLVKPKHPTDELILTAHMEIPLSDGHVATNDLPLSVPVSRTAGYTMRQVFTNWATWSAVGTSIAGVGGWFLRRSRRRRKLATAAAPAAAEDVNA